MIKDKPVKLNKSNRLQKYNELKEILGSMKENNESYSSKELAAQIGIEPGASSVRIRSLITEVIKKEGYPIGATNHYFWIRTKKELNKYIGSLETRKMEIETRKKIVFENFMNTYPEEFTDEEEEDI